MPTGLREKRTWKRQPRIFLPRHPIIALFPFHPLPFPSPLLPHRKPFRIIRYRRFPRAVDCLSNRISLELALRCMDCLPRRIIRLPSPQAIRMERPVRSLCLEPRRHNCCDAFPTIPPQMYVVVIINRICFLIQYILFWSPITQCMMVFRKNNYLRHHTQNNGRFYNVFVIYNE